MRVVWQIDFLGVNTEAMLQSIMDRYIQNKIAPMMSIWEFTGKDDPDALLNQGVKWWTDRSQVRVQIVKDESKWFVTLHNTGTEKLQNAVLRMTEAQAWRLKEFSGMERAPRSLEHTLSDEMAGDEKILRLEIEKLAPGQTLTFTLERIQL